MRVGSGPERTERAEAYASLYIPYAMISSIAYARPEQLDANHCPDPERLGEAGDPSAPEWMQRLQAAGWRCVLGVSERLSCPDRYPDCQSAGLPDLQVWRRGSSCSELVVAFRGVNLRNISDWSYLRRVLRLSNTSDYGRLQAQIDGILTHSGCRGAQKVVAVGHSFGGGYAEQAAYANRKIRYVYAFNSYPVRGFADPNPGARARTKTGLGIDSVEEAGELFGWQRRLRQQFADYCNPRFRAVKFNLVPIGLPSQQHNIDTLTLNMIEVSRGAGAASGRRVAGEREAARCAAPGG